MMLLQLFLLLSITLFFYGIIVLCSGGVKDTRPVWLDGTSIDLDIPRAVRRGASPIWLNGPPFSKKELTIIRRHYPWIFVCRCQLPSSRR